jgi:hypothetical protein
MGEARRKRIADQHCTEAAKSGVGIVVVRDAAQLLMSGGMLEVGYTAALMDWLKQALSRKPGDGALCVDCDHEFVASDMPHVFVMVVPVVEDAETMVISGVCPSCATKSDSHLAMRMARGLGLKNVQVVSQSGHA